MHSTASPEQERLQRLEGEIQDWKKRLIEEIPDAAAGQIDRAYNERFKQTVHRLVQLNDELHPEDFDPEALAELRGILLKMVGAVEGFSTERPLDSLDEFLVQGEALRHIVRDALDGHVSGAEDDARAVILRLQTWLPQLTQKEISKLVGRSPRTLQRWATKGGRPSRRLRLVGRLVALLRRGWTDDGVVAWFYRPRRELRGRAPIDLLEDVESEQSLMIAARQGRAQHGA